MLTLDSWLVARLARDLDATLRGARVQGIQTTSNALFLYCYRRGEDVVLHANVDSNAPLVAAYPLRAPQKESGSTGWAGTAAGVVRNASIDAVHAVPNDRILFVDLRSRSAFGVPSTSRLVIELQPRKANALFLRPIDDRSFVIVAAAKQFARTDGGRSVAVGTAYVMPPARRPQIDRAQFIVLASQLEPDDSARFVRLLGEFDPACTPPLAREVIFTVQRDARQRGLSGAVDPRAFLDAWSALARQVEDALADSGPIFVVRKRAVAQLCHLVTLHWPDGEASTAVSVNEVCAQTLEVLPAQSHGADPRTLHKKLATMLARLNDEADRLERSKNTAANADSLKDAGDAIYAHLSEIQAGSTEFVTRTGVPVPLDPLLTAKQNAAEYFRKYKKARSGLPHIQARLGTLRTNREYFEHLLWELERIDADGSRDAPALLAEIADAAGLRSKGARRQRRQTGARRVSEQTVDLGEGVVAYVGRSPKDNERLTFLVARPNDYWFHARGVPGAHVIVKAGDGPLSGDQIERAAALAAGNSRGARSTYLEVDYTQRKHVRRQAGGRPGLVWYTDFSTVRVAPESSSLKRSTNMASPNE